MIAWWGWLLIWVGLVLLLLGVVALLGWRLVKRFFVLLDDLMALADKAAILDAVTQSDNPRPANAIAEDAAVVRERFGARMERRANRKAVRRQARIQRAKMITTAEVNPADYSFLKE